MFGSPSRIGPNELTAITEAAKAASEVAKTTGKGIDAGREFGTFVARFIGGPLEQASGMVQDKLTYMRWERQVRLMERGEEFLRQKGLDAPTRSIPMKVAIPLLQAASLEEDDELQDIWARLLVNAADADSGVDVTSSLVAILNDFGILEARVLQAIHDAPAGMSPNGAVVTTCLPDAYVPRSMSDLFSEPAMRWGLEKSTSAVTPQLRKTPKPKKQPLVLTSILIGSGKAGRFIYCKISKNTSTGFRAAAKYKSELAAPIHWSCRPSAEKGEPGIELSWKLAHTIGE